MSLSTQPYKGARDFYPEDKRIQKYLFSTMRKAVEAFGYEEYDAPILEPLELYLAKSGEEIVNEQTYTFTDRGGRQVVIRPEMTPTVGRMVAAKRQDLAYPLRLYSIPNLWRYERPQRGRLREHWQLNVDVFGLDGIEAEVEAVMVADHVLATFGAKREMYEIRLNDRAFIDHFLKDYLALADGPAHVLSKLIDRMAKMERTAFMAEAAEILRGASGNADRVDKLMGVLECDDLDRLPEQLKTHDTAKNLTMLQTRLKADGIANVRFEPALMRGFDYYTGCIFEVFDLHPENNRSMFGGGRYDGLVGLFGVEPVPTIGFGMGDVTLQNFLESHDLLPALPPETDLYVVLIGEVADKVGKIVTVLRKDGLRIAVDYSGRKPDKQIKAAIKKGIVYAMFIGEEELKTSNFKVRNFVTGEEVSADLAGIVRFVCGSR